MDLGPKDLVPEVKDLVPEAMDPLHGLQGQGLDALKTRILTLRTKAKD